MLYGDLRGRPPLLPDFLPESKFAMQEIAAFIRRHVS